MTARTKTLWTFVITSIALFMVTLDNLVVTTAIPVIRAGPRRVAREPRVDGQRLHAHVRGAAPDRRGARRPLRPPAGLRDRRRHLHARLGRGRARADRRGAEHRARRAGARRRDRDAADADDPQRGGADGEARARARRLGRDQRPRGRVRPGRRRRRRRGALVAVDLLAQRPDRHPADPARALAPEETYGPARQARPARARARQRRPVRDRLGPDPRQRPGLDEPGDRRLARARRSCSWRRSSPGSCGRRRRCCRCASSASRRSRSRTSPRCSCSSGCSARSSCSRSSSRPCRATRRSAPGLRILPWTLAPMFIAPIAGALSDRIPGEDARRRSGSSLQAVALAWIGARLDADGGVLDADRARSSSPASGWRSSSPRWRTSSSRPCGREEEGQASGANNAIRELGGVFGVAVLASVFASFGGYESGQAFVRRDEPGALHRRRRRRPRSARRVRDPGPQARGASRRRAGGSGLSRPFETCPRDCPWDTSVADTSRAASLDHVPTLGKHRERPGRIGAPVLPARRERPLFETRRASARTASSSSSPSAAACSSSSSSFQRCVPSGATIRSSFSSKVSKPTRERRSGALEVHVPVIELPRGVPEDIDRVGAAGTRDAELSGARGGVDELPVVAGDAEHRRPGTFAGEPAGIQSATTSAVSATIRHA